MNKIKSTIGTAVACGALAALLIYANAAQPLKIDFSDETVGAEPKSFLSVVGVWRIDGPSRGCGATRGTSCGGVREAPGAGRDGVGGERECDAASVGRIANRPVNASGL